MKASKQNKTGLAALRGIVGVERRRLTVTLVNEAIRCFRARNDRVMEWVRRFEAGSINLEMSAMDLDIASMHNAAACAFLASARVVANPRRHSTVPLIFIYTLPEGETADGSRFDFIARCRSHTERQKPACDCRTKN